MKEDKYLFASYNYCIQRFWAKEGPEWVMVLGGEIIVFLASLDYAMDRNIIAEKIHLLLSIDHMIFIYNIHSENRASM